MKNIKIYPKDWLQLHPYKQADPTDLYYSNIANRIYDILEETQLANSFEKEEVKQISMRMSAYFEDVISGLNIWRSFITEHKALYEKYIPFYTTDDHYYEDEVNYEDIRFLLWHFTQQYHGAARGTFVGPDNAANLDSASRIYQLLCDEWTTAPENSRMQKLFAAETRYDEDAAYQELLHWFHYQCYLFTDSQQLLTEVLKANWNQQQDIPKDQSILYYHNTLAYVLKSPFLAYTAPKWLSIILPENHPDHDRFVEIGEQTQQLKQSLEKEEQKVRSDEFKKFNKATKKKPLFYFEEKQACLDFLTQAGIDPQRIEAELPNGKGAIYATPTEGLQLLAGGIEYIKDKKNPFYDAEKAASQAISFFMVHQCDPYLLKLLEEKGMLADAKAKSLVSEGRSKAIIHENWDFLMRYFLRTY